VAIVAEVNNTFGERHLYLLRQPSRSLRWGELLRADKQFHVSPFFKVEGEYSFRFLNTTERSVARVDYSLGEQPALQTSLSGSHLPLNDSSALQALLRYPLFSLAVVARIHWHALRLWIQKRIQYVPKPLPPTDLITHNKP
jgi:uncharacterized protein